jgi:sec-independent protein translocase protein TatC
MIIAAIITPTSDVFTMLIVTFPIVLLYEASIFLVRHTVKKRQTKGEN